MRRAGVGALALTCAFAADPSAAAAEPDSSGFSLRLRAAVAFPGGKQDDEHHLSDTYGVLLPIDLEAGYWVLPRLLVGARGSIGVLTVADEACAPPLECAATDYRFGAVAEYRFDVTGAFRKWASLGVGWEIARLAIHRDGASASRVDSGPEYFHAELGGDFGLGRNFGLGPYVGASVGEFRTATLHQADGSKQSYSIQESKLHQWIFLGVRGTWSP
jgi:opacity protein-like surface antigen